MSPRIILVEGPRFAPSAGAPSVPQGVADTKALDLDGSTETLANDTQQAIGIANEWSIVVWLMKDDFDNGGRIFRFYKDGDNDSRIESTFNSGANEFQMWVYNTAGTRFKLYGIDDTTLSVDVWIMFAATWDGTNLTLYIDGSDVTGSANKATDDTGTQQDSSRRAIIGAFDSGAQASFGGRIHSTALWSVELSSDIVSDLYNGGAGGVVDFREAQGAYTSTEVTALQHYWRHGFNSSDIGEDLGNGTAIDVGTDASNVTSADIVTDSPT